MCFTKKKQKKQRNCNKWTLILFCSAQVTFPIEIHQCALYLFRAPQKEQQQSLFFISFIAQLIGT